MKQDITFGVIGRINDKLFDGQTVKTRTLTTALKNSYPGCRILMAESSQSKKNPVGMCLQVLRCVREADVIFVLLSRNGLRIILPILFALNRIWKKPVIHDCVGGIHHETVRRYPQLRKYYRQMAVNWVETESMKQKLVQEGFSNVEVLPNFKNIRAISPEDVEYQAAAPFRFCTFSRVNEAKGIGRAAEAVLDINSKAGSPVAELHVYGPIEDNYGATLDGYIQRSEGAITYCGVADPDSSVDVLRKYYGMLFPTTYFGEGFPGTLIDAFSAGLPVIATDWHCNGEIVTHGKTGWIYSTEEPEKLTQWMEYAIAHPEEFHQMRFACLEAAKQFDTQRAMATVCGKIDALTSEKQ